MKMPYYEVRNFMAFNDQVYGRYSNYHAAKTAAIRASWSRRVVIIDPFGHIEYV